MNNQACYQGTVVSATKDSADILYEGGVFRVYKDQLKGLRLGRGQPVAFMMQGGEPRNLDIDGGRIPEGRSNGRVLTFDDVKNIGLLLDDRCHMEVAFLGRNMFGGEYPVSGMSVSYRLYRARDRISASEIRKC